MSACTSANFSASIKTEVPQPDSFKAALSLNLLLSFVILPLLALTSSNPESSVSTLKKPLPKTQTPPLAALPLPALACTWPIPAVSASRKPLLKCTLSALASTSLAALP